MKGGMWGTDDAFVPKEEKRGQKEVLSRGKTTSCSKALQKRRREILKNP